MGKKKYIESPEKMWELFEAYRKEVKANPKKVHDFVGKDGIEVFKLRERPLIDKGFFNYCRRHIGCARQYFDNQDGLYGDYIAICSRIRQEIDEDQIDGGMTNIYNPSITQRLQGLIDRREIDDNRETKIVIESYSKEEADRNREAMDNLTE